MTTQLPYTPVDQIPQVRRTASDSTLDRSPSISPHASLACSRCQIIERVRKNWDGGRSRPLEYRKNQIKQLGFLVQDNEEAFVQALASDVRRACECSR